MPGIFLNPICHYIFSIKWPFQGSGC